ncbi:MAG: prepilin peptidase [Rhodospirillaceae bacterium]|jgi:leader peptidase (prepilin peptidase) / N-methyltransferase|nr:prepilin peptidase [Rhodospirillaceae bacterium]MBT5241451.1 prepilin peptidase [Rhodospirillaceae bacterium]MBT5566279.1 prepilin peptidase [Rhodospirillaceae bacterium]MBT6089060.1 prepilin peptidase [Rhodospirillaceae bacterium]
MSSSLILYTSIIMLTAGLGTLAWIDFKTGYLPDSLQIALTVAALAVLALGSPIGVTWTGAAWGAAINGCTFWSLRWIMTRVKGREAMGFGDVKLVAVGGLWLGPWALPYVMALSGLLTLVAVGVAALILRKPTWRGEIPLGPGLAVGILAAYLAAIAGVTGIVGPAPL